MSILLEPIWKGPSLDRVITLRLEGYFVDYNGDLIKATLSRGLTNKEYIIVHAKGSYLEMLDEDIIHTRFYILKN